jgi:Outer membrane protein beta-barrel domain
MTKSFYFWSLPMKRFLYSIPLLCCCLISQAQSDTTKPKMGLSEYDLKNYKSNPSDRLILEVNYTGWLGTPKNIKADWKSVGFSFSTLFDKPIASSNFSFGYGLGLYCHNYSSNANFVYQLDSLSKHVKTILEPKTIPYSANRYNERIVEIPLELRYRNKTARTFKVMVGAKIGYVVSNFKKTDDADGRIRRYNIKNVNHFRYGVNLRIGVEQVCLTASYYFSEVFTENGEKGIHPFSIGIAIIPY